MDSLLIPQDTTKHPGMLRCLHCIPEHSQLRLSTKFIAFHSPSHLNAKRVKKKPLTAAAEEEESSHLCGLGVVFSVLAVQREAQG